MKIIRTGIAGTLESSDVMITIKENRGKGVEINLQSIVKKQFGKQIMKVITDTLQKFDIEEALVQLNDRGAIDPILEARLITAIYRASGTKNFDWELIC